MIIWKELWNGEGQRNSSYSVPISSKRELRTDAVRLQPGARNSQEHTGGSVFSRKIQKTNAKRECCLHGGSSKGIEAGSRSQRNTYSIGQGEECLRDKEKQPGISPEGGFQCCRSHIEKMQELADSS